MKLSRKQFAQHIGTSTQYIDHLVKTGIVTTDKGGLIDAEKAKKSIIANSHPGHDGRRKSKIRSDKDQDPRTLRELKRQHLALQTRLLQLEYNKRKSELISIVDLRNQLAGYVKQFQNAFIALPDKVADIIAGTNDRNAVHNVLTFEIRETLIDHAAHLRGPRG
jgi:hypothetical protein